MFGSLGEDPVSAFGSLELSIGKRDQRMVLMLASRLLCNGVAGSDVGDAALVEVVGSSPACS